MKYKFEKDVILSMVIEAESETEAIDRFADAMLCAQNEYRFNLTIDSYNPEVRTGT